MEYVIPILLVILLVAGFVTFLVMNATNKAGPNAEGEPGPPGMGTDETPLGDTTQHAGEQTPEGTTPRGQDDGRFTGRGPRAPGRGRGRRAPRVRRAAAAPLTCCAEIERSLVWGWVKWEQPPVSRRTFRCPPEQPGK